MSLFTGDFEEARLIPQGTGIGVHGWGFKYAKNYSRTFLCYTVVEATDKRSSSLRPLNSAMRYASPHYSYHLMNHIFDMLLRAATWSRPCCHGFLAAAQLNGNPLVRQDLSAGPPEKLSSPLACGETALWYWRKHGHGVDCVATF